MSSELNEPGYFKDVLPSQWMPGDVLWWRSGFVIISTEEEKLWIPLKLIFSLKKRNVLRRRNDGSSTKVTTNQEVRKPYNG